MDICRENDALQVSDLDPFLAELLRQIPASTNPEGVPAAEQRIFSAPVADLNQKKVCEEWKTYVQPELRRLFQSSTETVTSDLAQLNGNQKSLRNCTLRIPLDHADAWLNALNQARLVIAAKYNFSEGELNDHYHSPVGSRRDLGLFQVNFYGFLQEFILRELSNS
jgi:Domain of unknown function (DUF2017)